MRTVVVTGPVCSGKSTLTEMLAHWGAAVIDADCLGHRLLKQTRICGQLVAALGTGILSDRVVDRKKLGQLVFHQPEALTKLNAIMHPPLARQIDLELAKLANKGEHTLAVLEAAVYFLLPITWPVDLVIVVDAPVAMRQRRLENRNAISPVLARERIQAQAGFGKQWEHADLVVANDLDPEKLAGAMTEILVRLGLAKAAN